MERPGADRWDLHAGIGPHSVPSQMPDRYEHPQTILFGPRGEPLIVKRPRQFGFRPIKEQK